MRTLLVSLFLIIISPTLFGQSITIGEDGIVRCKDVAIGTTEEISGDTYEVVNRDLLIQRRDEGADLSKVCTSLINDMDRLFYMSVINHDIGNWDVSSVNNMRQMFRSSTFNKDISKWDVSSVTNMSGMFMQSDFNQSISDWNVNSVKDMSSMFSLSKFNGDISSWDVSNVTNLVDMFFSSPFNNDISNWNVSSVTDMSYMFNISSFNQNISNWDVSQVTAMVSMFDGAPFNQDIGGWDVANVTDMGSMFKEASSFNQDIGGWDVANVTNMDYMFNDAKSFNQNLSDWCVPKINEAPINFKLGSAMPKNNFSPIWGTCASVNIENEEIIPDAYKLNQNYPNPFNPSTQIHYALPEATRVTLEVFNNVGQKVMELLNGQKSAGLHTATFDASGLSSGVYLYKLTTPSFTETKKMLLIK